MIQSQQTLNNWLEAAIQVTLQRVLSLGGQWNELFDISILLIVDCNLLVVDVASPLEKLIFLLRCSNEWIGTDRDKALASWRIC